MAIISNTSAAAESVERQQSLYQKGKVGIKNCDRAITVSLDSGLWSWAAEQTDRRCCPAAYQ